MSVKRVTLVVTQRERMSAASEALDAVYAETPQPFDLVYVVGTISRIRRQWLAAEAGRRGFKLVEAGRPLTPAEGRNLGLAQASTEFVVFVENDVIPKRGWLEALLACADETAADVIVPLTCEGRPLHTIVHHVGPLEEPTPGADGSASGQRNYDETFHLQGQTREQVASKLIRRRTQTCEFHCVMMRRSLFNRIEPFDPLIVSKEHLDFSWRVTTADGAIWVEPGAVVTFLVPSASDPIRLTDLPYFLLRWSPHWQRRSHDSLKAKWGLQEAGYISSRRKLSGWRIVQHVVRPALERTPLLGRRWGFVERAAHLVYPAVAFAAAMLAWRYEARREHARDNERVSA